MASSISQLGIINFIGQIQYSDNISAIDISNLGVIPTAEDAKAEGLTLLQESSSGYEVAIVLMA